MRLLIKYPLGTAYPKVLRTAAWLYGDASKNGEVVSFAVDATGVGTVPAQMLQEMIPEARVEAFVFNNQKKRQLVGMVKMLHSFGRLKFATRRGEADYNRTLTELIAEMKAIQARVINEDPRNPEIEVFKTGSHDDIFTALALAVKDIPVTESYEDFMLLPDNSFLKTPLDAPGQSEPIFFG